MDGVTRVGVILACLALGVGLLWPPEPAPVHPAAAPASSFSASATLSTDAAAVLSACKGSGAGLRDCALREIEKVLAAQGSPAAFKLLAETTASTPMLQHEDHQMAHDLGRASIAHYPDTPSALDVCPTNMASGCFHGVLEAHFGASGPPAVSADVVGLCSDKDGWNRQFQCLHGLGHGLTMVAGHELPTALDWCGLLQVTLLVDSCEGGAFMENIMGTMQVADHHHHGNSTWVRLKPSDLAYPCNAVGERHQATCWFLQSSAVLAQGFGIGKVFEVCDGAPAPYVDLCYRSAGRDISGRELRDGPSVTAQCLLGASDKVQECIHGAVQEMVNNAGRVEPGLDYCPQAPEATRGYCFEAVGAMVAVLHPTPEGIGEQCAKAGAGPSEDACLRGAGVYVP